MRPAFLIFNARAGTSRKTSPEALIAALQEAGYQTTYLPTHSANDLPSVLAGITGTVFIAGGDGTFRAAALQLLGCSEVQLGLIPLGTSNNIARTLGLDSNCDKVINQYRNSTAAPFDVGHLRAPWGEDFFFEACGCGVFADVLHAYDPSAPKSPLRAVRALVNALPDFVPLKLRVTADGERLPSPSVDLLEVMNIQATGNSMRLAPDARPDDGLLNLVRVDAEQRDSLLAYAAALLQGDFDHLPSVLTTLARNVQVPYLGQIFHVDGETRPPIAQQQPHQEVRIDVWPGALQVLRPNTFLPSP